MADDINRRNNINKTGKEKNKEKDSLIPHLSVKKHLCLRCVQKPCITVCPAGTYQWDETFSTLEVDSGVCLDCGACRFVCPFDAITWSYRSKSNNQKTEKPGTGSYVPEKTISKHDYAARDIQESEPELKTKAAPDPAYDHEPEPESETGSAPDPELEQGKTIVPASDFSYEPEPEPVAEPEPGRDHDPEPDYEFIQDSDPDPEPETKSAPENNHDAKSESVTTTEPETKADPEPAYDHDSEPEPETKYIPDHESAPEQVHAKNRSNIYSSAYAYAGASSSYPYINDTNMPEYPESPEQYEKERLYLMGLLPEKQVDADEQPAPPPEDKSHLTHLSLKYIILHVIRNIINFPRKSGKVQSSNGERTNLQLETEEKKGRGKIILLIAAVVLLLFSLLYVYNQYTNLQDKALERIEQGVFYSNDANWTGWEGVDYELSDGSVTLEQKIYHAPYYRYRLSPEDMPWDEAVVKLTSQLDNFNNRAYTLLTVYTSAGEIALITDPAGRLALVTDVDQIPDYTDSVLEGEEHDIHLFLDVLNGDISVYVDGRHIFTEEKDYYMYTLQEIWLGAFWIGGNNQFGAPRGHTVSEVVLGDSSLLLSDYTFGQFISEQMETSPWLWVPLVLAVLLILLYLILLIRDKKRSKVPEAGDKEGIQA